MRSVFADTFFWIALASPRDQWHQRARDIRGQLQGVRIVTSDEVLVEFLAYFAKQGIRLRTAAANLVRKIQDNPNITVTPQTRDSFTSGFELYEQRLDKEYSLTDCISMENMRREDIQEVLTHDSHFAQEGFTILFP